jgi:hypothetical protein
LPNWFYLVRSRTWFLLILFLHPNHLSHSLFALACFRRQRHIWDGSAVAIVNLPLIRWPRPPFECRVLRFHLSFFGTCGCLDCGTAALTLTIPYKVRFNQPQHQHHISTSFVCLIWAASCVHRWIAFCFDLFLFFS